MRSRAILLLTILILPACTHNVALSPTIQPNAFIGNKHPQKVIVVMSDDIKSYIVHARPSSFAGSAHSYNFEAGAALTAALQRAVEVAYEEVVLAEGQPAANQSNRIIKFSLANSNIDVSFDDGFLTTSAKANYSVAVTVEVYDGITMAPIRKSTVSGVGFVGKGNSDAFSSNQVFAKAVEAGIQQLADNVANMLVGGFGEPRTSGAP